MGQLERALTRTALALARWLVTRTYRKTWRHRHALCPFALSIALSILQSIEPRLSVLAVSFWTAVSFWKWTDRQSERVYVLSVGLSMLGWSTWTTHFHGQPWTAVPLSAVLSIPYWWHRRIRLSLLGRFGAVREALSVDGFVVRPQRLDFSEYGWTRVLRHPGHTSDDLRKHVPMLESRLGVLRGSLAVEDCPTASRSRLAVTTKPLPRVIPVPARLVRSIYDPFPVGMSRSLGRERTLSLACKHGVIAGTTGAGKSSFARTLVRQVHAAYDAEMLHIDLKAGAEAILWVDVTGHGNIAENVDQAEAFLDYAIERLKLHGQIMRNERMGATFKASQKHKALVVMIDEGSDLIEAGLGPKIIWLVEKGRAMGVWVHYMTQHPTEATLPVRIRKNVMFTAGLRAQDMDASAQIFGRSASKAGWNASALPSGGGWFQLKDDAGDTEQYKGYFIEDTDVPGLCVALEPQGTVMGARVDVGKAAPAALKWIKDERPVGAIAEEVGLSKRTVQRRRAEARRIEDERKAE
jgi:hypothetical protein